MKRRSLFVAVINIAFLGVLLSGCGGGTDQRTKTYSETYADGSKYVGGFKDGLFDGYGTLTYPDGRQYVGQFKEGQMDGTGKMTHPDGKVEEGFWKQNWFFAPSFLPFPRTPPAPSSPP